MRAGLKSYADTLDEIRIEGLALIYQEVYQTSAAPDPETAALFLQTLREGQSFQWVRIQTQVRKDLREQRQQRERAAKILRDFIKAKIAEKNQEQ